MPAEAIHGARKDLKKLRTLLRLLRDELPKTNIGKILRRSLRARVRAARRLYFKAPIAVGLILWLAITATIAGSLPH